VDNWTYAYPLRHHTYVANIADVAGNCLTIVKNIQAFQGFMLRFTKMLIYYWQVIPLSRIFSKVTAKGRGISLEFVQKI